MDKEIKEYFDNQLKDWELARKNFEALENVERRDFQIGDFKGYLQYNPARAISSLAKLDSKSIRERQCFLCECNRPKEQQGKEIIPGWDLCINPFPILPYHFTIVAKEHVPQTLNTGIGKELAEKLPGMVVFFNDAGAGASAPDHLHFQAAPIDFIPLINILSKNENAVLPFKVVRTEEEITKEKAPMNAFFWKNENSGNVEIAAIPRTTHRPKQYFLEPPERRALSPGALDMAGVLVCAIKDDYLILTEEEIEDIYKQVSIRG